MLRIREYHSIKKLLHNRGIGLDSPCGIHVALLGMNISNLSPPFPNRRRRRLYSYVIRSRIRTPPAAIFKNMTEKETSVAGNSGRLPNQLLTYYEFYIVYLNNDIICRIVPKGIFFIHFFNVF